MSSNSANELYFRVAGDSGLVPITAGMTLGSHEESTLVVKDDAVSAEHAVVLSMGGQTLLQALASGASTRILEGERVVEVLERNQCHPLTVGVSVELGRCRLDVLGGDPAGNGVAPSAAGLDGEATIIIPSPPVNPAADLEGDATVIGAAPLSGDETIIQGGVLDGDATIIQGGADDDDRTVIQGGLGGEATQIVGGAADAAGASTPSPASPPHAAPASTSGDTLVRMVGIQASNPRLVFTTPGFQRVEKVVTEVFRVGSGRGRAVECEVDHPEVSRVHAEIRFEKRRYVIEDHRSHNGTQINGSDLPPGVPHTLEPESHVRFGAVDAVFVVDTDSTGKKVPAQQHHRAIDILVEAGLLSARRRSEVIQEYEARRGDCSPIELLLREGIDGQSWALAFREQLSSKKNPWKWIAIGAVALGLVALAIAML